MVHWWVLVHYGPLRGSARKRPTKKDSQSWSCHDSLYQSIQGILFWYTNKCNFTGRRSWRDPIDEHTHFWCRIPGDLTCMLANASLSIPLPNKGAFIEIGGLVKIPGSWVGLDCLCNIFHCGQSTIQLSRLGTQVCNKLKFLAASSSTFHSYPLVSWPPNKG